MQFFSLSKIIIKNILEKDLKFYTLHVHVLYFTLNDDELKK